MYQKVSIDFRCRSLPFYPFLVFKNDGMGKSVVKKYEEKSFEKLAKTAYFKRSI